MCVECWESVGRPTVFNDKVEKAIKLLEVLYELNGVGGFAHAVVDDWNLDGEFLYEFNWAHENEVNEPELAKASLDVLSALKEMTMDERYSTLAHFNGFWKTLG